MLQDNGNNGAVLQALNSIAAAIQGDKVVYIGGQFPDLNPLTTSAVDISGSSIGFTLNKDATVIIGFGTRFQINTNIHCTMRLLIDGVAVSTIQMGSGDAGVVLYMNTMKLHATAISAGSHTIKIHAYASTGSASVAIEPFWHGLIIY